MTIVGGFVFPHGPITLDPYTRDLSGELAYRPETERHCIDLHEAMTAQAEALVDTWPDLILMITPHGLRLRGKLFAHGNTKSTPSDRWLEERKEYVVEVDIDVEMTRKIVNILKSDGVPIETKTIGTSSVQTIPMNWGECVPLWFITQAYKRVDVDPPKAIILERRNTGPFKIAELTACGNRIAQFIGKEMSDKRVAVVVSCDLSHYHSTDPTSPCRYDKHAQTFDDLIVQWSKIDIDLDHLEHSNYVLISRAGIQPVEHVLGSK